MPLAEDWARRFGLAPAPLFADSKVGGAEHNVLLDGGFGSFAISFTNEPLWKDAVSSEWAWSSGLPHHVTVTDNEVGVVRWDSPAPEEFSRNSVEERLDAFYGYLVSDRVRANMTVIDHLMWTFRKTRSLVHESGLPDTESVNAYLAILAEAISRSGSDLKLEAPQADLIGNLRKGPLEQLVEDTVAGTGDLQFHRLHADLAVRHAGSEIFQEAHFSLTAASSADLFDWVGPATARKQTRGSSHFTPSALARSVVEQTLAEVPDLSNRGSLTILDPAVGSGSFLYEAIRAIRRTGFKGELHLIGRDISPAAISMARFTLALAKHDWQPAGGINLDLEVADFIEADVPETDIVLMNPPFLSWNAMDPTLRKQMQLHLGPKFRGRGDLSMLFVTRALASVRDGGALGALLPSSLLTLGAAEEWRKSLLESGDVALLASLGDYGLFTHAMVQVAALVLRRPTASGDGLALAVVAGNSPEATGDALRAIRRGGATPALSNKDKWEVYGLKSSDFRDLPTWRLVPPKAVAALERLQSAGITRPVGELFAIRQGVRTGMNSTFVISEQDFRQLPAKERKWFRPAAMGDNLVAGHLVVSEYLFYPYNLDGLQITSEKALFEAVPTYFERWLEPNRQRLAARASIVRSNRNDWWGLSERRRWGASGAPRIVSKYFGSEGSFALDKEAKFLIVQGFGWFARWDDINEINEDETEEDLGPFAPVPVLAGLPTEDLLAAYTALFNSRSFQRVARLFSSHVAGGQFDLSPRFMNEVPVPDLCSLGNDEVLGARVLELASFGRHMRADDPSSKSTVNRVVTDLYGTDIFEYL